MRFVLKRNEDDHYVTPRGSLRSYTKMLQKARRYSTRAAAEADACGNEQVIDIAEGS